MAEAKDQSEAEYWRARGMKVGILPPFDTYPLFPDSAAVWNTVKKIAHEASGVHAKYTGKLEKLSPRERLHVLTLIEEVTELAKRVWQFTGILSLLSAHAAPFA